MAEGGEIEVDVKVNTGGLNEAFGRMWYGSDWDIIRERTLYP